MGFLLVVVVFLACLGAVIGLNALILKLAARLVAKEIIEFGAAFVTVLIAGIVNLFASGLVQGLLKRSGADGLTVAVAGGVVSTVVFAIAVSSRHDISFVKSILIAILMSAIWIAVALLVATFILGAMSGSGAGAP